MWERLPKTTYVGLQQFKFGLYDAVAVFNMGRSATVEIFKELQTEPGKYTIEGCMTQNKKRLNNAAYKNKATVKVQRKIIRGRKKSKEDKTAEREGTTYEAGGF